MTDQKVFAVDGRKKPKVRVFKSDGKPVEGSLAKWVSPSSPKSVNSGGRTGSVEFLQGVADLRQIINQAINELDNLIEIIEPLKGGENKKGKTKNHQETKGQNNTDGILELLQSPIVHNLLGNLLSSK